MHGAIIRGGVGGSGGGGRRPVHRQWKICGGGNITAETSTSRALPEAGMGCSPTRNTHGDIGNFVSSDQTERSRQQRRGQMMPAISPVRRPETSHARDHRHSPPVGQVSVSWGEDGGGKEAMAKEVGTFLGSEAAEERIGPVGPKREIWNTKHGGGEGGGKERGEGFKAENGITGIEGSWGTRGSDGDSGGEYMYTPRSKASDYRKVEIVTNNGIHLNNCWQ